MYTSFNCVKVSLELDNEIFTVPICITKSLTINELMIKSIYEFNNLFQLKGLNIRLELNNNDYNFKPAKKTGRPKIDFPVIEKDIKVFDTGIEHFSLMYSKIIIIKTHKTFRCFYCPIL